MTATHPETRNYTHLIADVASGAKELAAAHVEQMGEEVKAQSDRAISTAALFSAAGTLMGIGFVFAIFAVAQLLQDRYGFSQTSALGLTGGIVFCVGLIFLGIARQQIRGIRWMPRRSLQSLEESLSWVTRR